MHQDLCNRAISATDAHFDDGVFSFATCVKSETCRTHHTDKLNANLVELQAATDPIAPARCIPRKAIQENPLFSLVVTPAGGHLGWVSGPTAPFGAPWTDAAVVEWLQSMQQVLSSKEIRS